MLVDSKQKIAHQLVLFVHQHLFISPLFWVSLDCMKTTYCFAYYERLKDFKEIWA